MLSEEVVATELALRLRQKAVLAKEETNEVAELSVPEDDEVSGEGLSTVEASPRRKPPVEWKQGVAPLYTPEELTGGEWHNIVLPLFAQAPPPA